MGAALALLLLLTACGTLLFGRFWPAMDDLTQASLHTRALAWLAFICRTFEFHAGLGAGGALVAGLVLRMRWLALAALPAAAWGVLPDAWLFVPPSWRAEVRTLWLDEPGSAAVAGINARTAEAQRAAQPETLSIMIANVLVGDRPDSAEALLREIDREKPDVLLIQEWDGRWARSAEADLRSRFRSFHAVVGSGAFGQAIACNVPLRQPVTPYPLIGDSPWQDPQMRFSVMLGNIELVINNMHLMSPGWGRAFEPFVEQREQVRSLAAWLSGPESPASVKTPRQDLGSLASHSPESHAAETGLTAMDAQTPQALLLAGDFNMHATTSHYAELLRDAGMREAHAEAGLGRGSTWPRIGRSRFAPGIRLDQAWVRGPVRVTECRVLDDIGSDHKPVLIRLEDALDRTR